MSEIIDILTLPIATAQRFTVNTAVTNVALTTPGGLGFKHLQGAAATGLFQNGDSFSILAAGLVLPEGFTPYKDPAVTVNPLIPTELVLQGANSLEIYNIDVLGFYSSINIEMENFEQALDVFCNCINQVQISHPTVKLNEAFFLACYSLDIKISMLNVPAAYNGKTFFVSPFFKILHNFPLLAP